MLLIWRKYILIHVYRYLHADIVSMVASVVASTHQPDPSESGLFDAPPQPRQTSYKLLEANYTWVEFLT